MKEQTTYINVILPLKLGWEPFYVVEDWQAVQVGDRVTVPFAGRRYIGVVSAVGVPLEEWVSPSSVKKIRCMNTDLPSLLPSEIEFFRAVASYYMCTVGEVFKMAYPTVRDVTPSARASRVEQKVEEPACQYEPESRRVLELADLVQKKAVSGGKPVLLSGGVAGAQALLKMMWDFACGGENGAACGVTGSRSALGRNVLWLVPDAKFTKTVEEEVHKVLGSKLIVWRSDLTPSRRRKALERMRSGEPYVVLGTKGALFLPHRELGLIIIQDEHELSYKNYGGAPRYNGRDAAVLLSSQTGAAVVLESASPSLESVYNAAGGKYVMVGELNEKSDTGVPLEVVDTRAEMRKNGMIGEISKKLLHACGRDGVGSGSGAGAGSEPRFDGGSLKVAVYKPSRAMFPKMEELAQQVPAVLGADVFLTDDLMANPIPEDTQVLAVMGIDSMLSRADFRADERAYHAVMQAIGQCSTEQNADDASPEACATSKQGRNLQAVVIQTRESDHPVFAALSAGDVTVLLQERQMFQMPPYTRLVDILVRDTFPDRAARMLSALNRRLCALGVFKTMLSADRLRVMLPRNKYLISRKETLLSVVENFEKEEKYASHLSFDVDPM